MHSASADGTVQINDHALHDSGRRLRMRTHAQAESYLYMYCMLQYVVSRVGRFCWGKLRQARVTIQFVHCARHCLQRHTKFNQCTNTKTILFLRHITINQQIMLNFVVQLTTSATHGLRARHCSLSHSLQQNSDALPATNASGAYGQPRPFPLQCVNQVGGDS